MTICLASTTARILSFNFNHLPILVSHLLSLLSSQILQSPLFFNPHFPSPLILIFSNPAITPSSGRSLSRAPSSDLPSPVHSLPISPHQHKKIVFFFFCLNVLEEIHFLVNWARRNEGKW